MVKYYPFLIIFMLIVSCHSLDYLTDIECSTNTSVCNFECTEIRQCETRILTCLPGKACNLKCSNTYSCRNTKIICPKNADCTISCTKQSNMDKHPEQICTHIIIKAQESKSLSINVTLGGLHNITHPRTMENAQIYCPINGRKKCLIDCHGNDLMRDADIYATEGFNDLILHRRVYEQVESINPAKDVCMRSTLLHCNLDYTQNCVIANYGFIDRNGITYGALCQKNSKDTTCETIMYPTLSPTFSPTTMQPSWEPTVEPTFSFTRLNTEETTLISETAKELEKIDQDENGWSDLELIFAILLPMLLVLCIAVCICVCSSERKGSPPSYYTKSNTTYKTSANGHRSHSSYGFDVQTQENSSEWYDTELEIEDEKTENGKTVRIDDDAKTSKLTKLSNEKLRIIDDATEEIDDEEDSADSRTNLNILNVLNDDAASDDDSS